FQLVEIMAAPDGPAFCVEQDVRRHSANIHHLEHEPGSMADRPIEARHAFDVALYAAEERVCFGREADKGNALALKAVLQLHERGHIRHALRAIGGPEIDDDELAAEVV